MNTEMTTKATKDFLQAKIVRVQKDYGECEKVESIKLVTTDRRTDLLLEPSYHTIKWISENLLVIETNKVELKMNKLVCLGRFVLYISRIAIYEYWHDYTKPK